MIIAVTSDVHLGREGALVEEFFQAMVAVAKKADIIVIAGDIVENDGPLASELFSKFLSLAKQHSFFEKLFFVYGGMKHEIKLLHATPGLLLNDYCLLSTAIGRVVIIHGNNIGLYYNPEEGENAKLGAERAKRNLIRKPVNWLPVIQESDYLILGHLHKRFYHEPARIYCLGCWLPTKDTANDTGYILLINDRQKDPFKALSYTAL